MSTNWNYLGDGVYAKFDAHGVWLHANDHQHPTDRIYLEWPVLDSLNKRLEILKGAEQDDNPKSR